MRKTDGKVRIALLVGLLAAGCGSGGASGGTGGSASGGAGGHATGGGGNGGGTCQPLIPGDGTATWTANGVAECATVTVAEHDVATLADTLELVGSTTTGTGFGLVVSVYTGALGGTYTCKGDGGVGAPYVSLIIGPTADDCTVTIDSAGTPGGAHATGTFSATARLDGGLITATSGHFDTPVTTIGG